MDFPDTCTIQNALTIDMYHGKEYTHTFTSCCRYREIIDKPVRGDNIIVTAWMALPACTPVTTESKITLKDGSAPTILTKKNVIRLSDNQIDYIKIEFGKTGVN